MAATIADFERNGFVGPLNYYRAIQPYFDMAGVFAGASIRQPSLLLTGALDPLNQLRPIGKQDLRRSLPGLRDVIQVSGAGHWPQLAAAEDVNAALLQFLATLDLHPKPKIQNGTTK